MSGPGQRDVSLLQVPEAQVASQPADPEEEEEDEEDAFKVHLIPRSSPTPRKKSSCSEEAEEPSLTRKVSFADSCGLALVQVKYYEEFAVPQSPEPIDLGVQETDQPPCYVFPAFILPATQTQLLDRVQVQKVEVESIEPLAGDPLSVQGLIRVLNLSFQKSVYIRATQNNWTSYFDHPAEYVAGSSDGHTDRFSFRLSFVAPYVRDGARVEFVVRYETPAAVYWANNGGSNYSLVCKAKEQQAAPTPKAFLEVKVAPLRSCLKPMAWRYNEEEEEEEDMEEPDWERHDWTNDADVSASSTGPNDWIVQVPRVQVISLSTPASLEGLASTLAEQTQEAPEARIRRNEFIPIEEAHGARLQDNSMERDVMPESKSYLGRSAGAFQQQEPVSIPSLRSREEEEEGGGRTAPDLLEAPEENNVHVVQQSTKVQENIGAKGICLTEEVSLPTESQLAKAMESPFQMEVLPASEGDSRVGVDSAPIAEESPDKGTIRTSLQEVGERDAGIDPWVANLNHQNEANHEMLGAVGQEENAGQQPSPPVGVVAPGLSKWEESARLFIAPSLQAVGTYHEEAGMEVGHELRLPPEAESQLSASPWGIASTNEPSLPAGVEQEFPQERVMGSESWLDPAALLDEMSATQRLSLNPNTPPPENETVEVSPNPERGLQDPRELRASIVKNGTAVSISCAENEDSRTGKRRDSLEATGVNSQQSVRVAAQDQIREAELPRAAPLPPPSAGWAEGDVRGTCTDTTGPVTLPENPLAAIRPRDELDLESLAVLKEVVVLASKFMQFLVFLLVAFNDSGSLLWCTLYLISVLLL